MNDFKVMNKNPNMKMDIMMKKRKVSESSKENEAQYYCNMCEKMFGLRQALGGHKTCHLKITIGKSPCYKKCLACGRLWAGTRLATRKSPLARVNWQRRKRTRRLPRQSDMSARFATRSSRQVWCSVGIRGYTIKVPLGRLPRMKRRWQRWEAKEKKWEWMLRMKGRSAICHNIGSIHGEHPCRN